MRQVRTTIAAMLAKRADRGYQQDQKAAIVLQHRVAADMRQIAANTMA